MAFTLFIFHTSSRDRDCDQKEGFCHTLHYICHFYSSVLSSCINTLVFLFLFFFLVESFTPPTSDPMVAQVPVSSYGPFFSLLTVYELFTTTTNLVYPATGSLHYPLSVYIRKYDDCTCTICALKSDIWRCLFIFVVANYAQFFSSVYQSDRRRKACHHVDVCSNFLPGPSGKRSFFNKYSNFHDIIALVKKKKKVLRIFDSRFVSPEILENPFKLLSN